MRLPTEYEMYLIRINKYYETKKMEQPKWIEKARSYLGRYNMVNRLFDICSDTNIPRSTMEWLADLENESLEELPNELRIGEFSVNSVLIEMYNELVTHKELYFLNEWTLTKKGRVKMREYLNRVPNISAVKPPKNAFTNVPSGITFSNGMADLNNKYELHISLHGALLYITNGNSDRTEYIDFTEGFFDNIIPMLQWENFEHLLHENNGENSIYQNYETVLVTVNQTEYELKLLLESSYNIFMQVLKLVWDEYSEELKNRDLLLPWFKNLGWE